MENSDLISVLKNIETRLENIENDGVYDTVRKPFSKILSICTNSAVEIKDKTNIVKEIKN